MLFLVDLLFFKVNIILSFPFCWCLWMGKERSRNVDSLSFPDLNLQERMDSQGLEGKREIATGKVK